VTKVSQNRKMPYEEVHAIAKGRIWSGEKAIQLGLVDKIGGLDDAINSASVMADIEDYKVVRYFEKMDPFDIFISEFLKNINIESSLSKNSKKLISFLSKEYKFIDEEKDINNISYCFDCEFFFFK
jgi:protease-4